MTDTTIEMLEETLQQAMLNGDVQALDELIADDLIFTLHSGLVISKQDDLEAHRMGLQKYRKIDITDQHIRHYGDDCAVVTLRADLEGVFDGESYAAPYRFTRIWAKRQNRWQIAAGHVSQISDAPLSFNRSEADEHLASSRESGV